MKEGKKLHALVQFMSQVLTLSMNQRSYLAISSTYTYEQLRQAFKKSPFRKEITIDEIRHLCARLVFDKLAEVTNDGTRETGILVDHEKISYAYQSKRYLNAAPPEFSWWKVAERAAILAGILGGIVSSYFFYDRYHDNSKDEIPKVVHSESSALRSDDSTSVSNNDCLDQQQ